MTVAAKNDMELISELDLTSVAIDDADKNFAIEVLRNTEMPTTRVEAWKYTRVAKLGKIAFRNDRSTLQTVSNYIIDDAAYTFVFVNGHLSENLSTKEIPNGVSCKILSAFNNEIVLPKSQLPLKGEIFNALNTAYLTEGLLIEVDENVEIEKPVQIIHILKGDQIISNFRTIIRAGKSSKSSVIQGFFTESGNSGFCNNITEIDIAENAILAIDKIQFESEASYHISTEQVSQGKNSTFTLNTLTLNGGLVRNNVHIDVNGTNCGTNLNGGYLLKNKQHVDNHTIVDHKVAHCESHELYKGVMDDNSTAVFNGKVFVRQDAQKINAFQSNGNVLLSDNATINSKPELEIYADDVKCSHGSTTGQLDDEALFYLKARGLSERSARQLLVSAFIGEVFEKIENEKVKSFALRLLSERFGWEL